ncbi:alpha/beta fold hydrolase [Nocardia sp. NPDC101769]|uniref:alpha/beta fold hydrolase n=1 Tax=Nocardia sp. NPDC101769 TaxID=3364333 RepID=UPI0037F9CBD4
MAAPWIVDVVIPSHPGYAFSGPTRVPAWHPARTAAAYHTLMLRLGYDRYGVHGSDVGAAVAAELGRLAPEQVIGVHVGQIFSFPRGDKGELDGLTTSDTAFRAYRAAAAPVPGTDQPVDQEPGTLHRAASYSRIHHRGPHPVFGRHDRAAEWLQVWTDLGRKLPPRPTPATTGKRGQ